MLFSTIFSKMAWVYLAVPFFIHRLRMNEVFLCPKQRVPENVPI